MDAEWEIIIHALYPLLLVHNSTKPHYIHTTLVHAISTFTLGRFYVVAKSHYHPMVRRVWRSGLNVVHKDKDTYYYALEDMA